MPPNSSGRKEGFPPVAKWKVTSLLLGVLFFVMLLLYFAEITPGGYPVLRAVLRSLAAVTLTSGIISVIFNLLIRQELASFWLDAIGVKASIEKAGLKHIELDFHVLDLRNYIRKSQKIDFCVIHAEKVIGNHARDFREFLSKPENELRACFLDKDSTCAPALIENFEYKDGQLNQMIESSIASLKSCIEDLRAQGKKTGRLRIWKQNLPPKHTFYRFDDAVLTCPR